MQARSCRSPRTRSVDPQIAAGWSCTHPDCGTFNPIGADRCENVSCHRPFSRFGLRAECTPRATATCGLAKCTGPSDKFTRPNMVFSALAATSLLLLTVLIVPACTRDHALKAECEELQAMLNTTKEELAMARSEAHANVEASLLSEQGRLRAAAEVNTLRGRVSDANALTHTALEVAARSQVARARALGFIFFILHFRRTGCQPNIQAESAPANLSPPHDETGTSMHRLVINGGGAALHDNYAEALSPGDDCSANEHSCFSGEPDAHLPAAQPTLVWFSLLCVLAISVSVALSIGLSTCGASCSDLRTGLLTEVARASHPITHGRFRDDARWPSCLLHCDFEADGKWSPSTYTPYVSSSFDA